MDSFRVKYVMGYEDAPLGTPGSQPMKGSEVSVKPVTKIIQGDWGWHPNRDVNLEQSAWHNFRGQPRFNMLFGDSHVVYFQFPKEMTEDWLYSPVWDLDFTWW
jgi:prepilin-type processing-associated H-X9-DG protein